MANPDAVTARHDDEWSHGELDGGLAAAWGLAADCGTVEEVRWARPKGTDGAEGGEERRGGVEVRGQPER